MTTTFRAEVAPERPNIVFLFADDLGTESGLMLR